MAGNERFASGGHITTAHYGNANAWEDLQKRKGSSPQSVMDIVTDQATANHARQATLVEKSMTLKQAFPLYKKAILFSLIYSTAIVMEGYDVALVFSFFAFPPFKTKYGTYYGEEHGYQIPSKWQSALTNGAYVGEIIGLYGAGIVVDKIGYRKTMILSLICMIGFIFIPFFAQNLATLLAGDIMQGIPWGVFQTMPAAYASEVCPVGLRAYLTTYINLCWVMGQFIATGVLRSFLKGDNEWAYRIPFALQWMWPIPIIVGVLFAPESPWWHIRKGNIAEARRSMRRLTSQKHAEAAGFDVDATIAMMVHTNELEKQNIVKTSYLQCFKGVDIRRTEIVSIVWVAQIFCGSGLIGFSVYFFTEAGLSPQGAFNMALVQYSLGAIGTVLSWFIMSWVGRRTLYCYGLFALSTLLLVVGSLGIPPLVKNGTMGWAIGGVLVVYTFIYDLTVGPICFSLVAELPSTRLKAKSIVLARNFYNMASIVSNTIIPMMINPAAAGWGAKAAFFWSGTCFSCWVWAYFRLPEPKGRTYGELDVLFENKVPARGFASADVDQFSSVDSLVAVENKDPK